MSVHSRGLFKRRKRLSFANPLTDEAESGAAEVTDDRLEPVTDHGRGIINDQYSKSDSANPRVQSPKKAPEKA